MKESGRVQPKFLHWTPEDVEEIDDLDTLMWLREKYTPFSQPQNVFEETYLSLMLEAVNNRLYLL